MTGVLWCIKRCATVLLFGVVLVVGSVLATAAIFAAFALALGNFGGLL